jgi:hypothetical protein
MPMNEPSLALFRRVEGDTVIRSGKLFHVGDYPDKRFSMNEAELSAACVDFSPAPVRVEHLPTIFDGKVGEVRAVRARGEEMFGEVAIPAWLDEVCGEDPIGVSCEFDRTSKKLVGLALVRSPRVSDAAIFSAYAEFARHDTPEGQMVMQDLHDHTARFGAVCSRPAEMHSQHEASAIQQAHDLAVQHGARCQPGTESAPAYYSTDAVSPTDAGTDPGLKEKPMTAWEWLQAKLNSEPAPTSAGGGQPDTPAQMSANEETERLKAELAQRDADLQTERAARAKDRAERIRIEAAAFADGEIAANRLLPCEREALIADFCERAEDDLQAPRTVTFSSSDGEKQGTRIDALRARCALRTSHILTTEQVPEHAATFANRDTPDPAAPAKPERVQALINLSPLRELADQNGRKN